MLRVFIWIEEGRVIAKEVVGSACVVESNGVAENSPASLNKRAHLVSPIGVCLELSEEALQNGERAVLSSRYEGCVQASL